MRVTMLGHAALLGETADVRILMDPWIVGPCNFRSWWHLPELSITPSDLPAIDYVYLSHLHDDHFHQHTLRVLAGRPTALIPRLYHDRMVRKLRGIGYTNIQELPHGKEVWLGPSTRITSMQIGNDSLLAVADSSAAMLNVNDALQGTSPSRAAGALAHVGRRYRFDIAFLAFGTAGGFPKCFRFEDPKETIAPERKEQAMLSNFVEGAKAIGARAVVPFAGGFALLSDRLLWMNDVKTTPADALRALAARQPDRPAFEMNPGDVWDSRHGVERHHPAVDWSQRLSMIRQMRHAHANEVEEIDERQRHASSNLPDVFRSRLAQNLRTFPALRQRLGCSVLFDVQGEPGGQWEVDLRGPTCRFREGDSGDWAMRLTIPAALLERVLTDPDGWEELSISYRLDLYFRKGARAKEPALTRLVNTPSLPWLLKTLCAPRFFGFVVRRRQDFVHMVREKLRASA